jgi:hypothetical protein
VIDVDTAREPISNNEILGIVQPHAATKASIAMAALGAANPITGYTVKGVQPVYGLSIRREIFFPDWDGYADSDRSPIHAQAERTLGWMETIAAGRPAAANCDYGSVANGHLG